MKVIHDLHNFWEENDVDFLAQFGIKRIPNDNEPIKIEEGYTYEEIIKYFSNKQFNPLREYIQFEYSKEEILASEYCVIRNYHYCGYPEHLNDITCEWQDNCTSCHYNAVQIDDYRVSKVAKHKLWGFFAWVFEVLFASVDLYQEVFEPLGIGCRPLRTKGGKIIDGVVQLVLPVIDEDMVFLNYNLHSRQLPNELNINC